jgi:NADPH-dependent 7-cyano-7-deazaguanine reductase QueF-like protein
METVVEISPDGRTIRFLYKDGHPLMELGHVKMERASNVLWDEDNQVWKLYMKSHNDQQIPFGNPEGYKRREDAIAAEIEQLNQLLLTGECSVPMTLTA